MGDAERAEKTRRDAGPRAERARVALETVEIMRAFGYDSPGQGRIDLRRKLLDAIDMSEFYPATGWSASTDLGGKRYTGITEVWCSTTLSAARALSNGPEAFTPGVLNFASARNPGGGFSTGAEAQEESIARSSGLYPCLTKYFNEFFQPHRNAASGSYTHAVIYSPAVPVFRDDQGQLLDVPYNADFLTAAAPNLGVMAKSKGRDQAEKVAEDELRERSRRVLQIFAERGAIDLVLGAWGCGVFRNNPTVVAGIFRNHLETDFRGRFRRIIFAVLDPKMAQEFAHVFGTEVAGHTAIDEKEDGSTVKTQKKSGKGNKRRE